MKKIILSVLIFGAGSNLVHAGDSDHDAHENKRISVPERLAKAKTQEEIDAVLAVYKAQGQELLAKQNQKNIAKIQVAKEKQQNRKNLYDAHFNQHVATVVAKANKTKQILSTAHDVQLNDMQTKIRIKERELKNLKDAVITAENDYKGNINKLQQESAKNINGYQEPVTWGRKYVVPMLEKFGMNVEPELPIESQKVILVEKNGVFVVCKEQNTVSPVSSMIDRVKSFFQPEPKDIAEYYEKQNFNELSIQDIELHYQKQQEGTLPIQNTIEEHYEKQQAELLPTQKDSLSKALIVIEHGMNTFSENVYEPIAQSKAVQYANEKLAQVWDMASNNTQTPGQMIVNTLDKAYEKALKTQSGQALAKVVTGAPEQSSIQLPTTALVETSADTVVVVNKPQEEVKANASVVKTEQNFNAPVQKAIIPSVGIMPSWMSVQRMGELAKQNPIVTGIVLSTLATAGLVYAYKKYQNGQNEIDDESEFADFIQDKQLSPHGDKFDNEPKNPITVMPKETVKVQQPVVYLPKYVTVHEIGVQTDFDRPKNNMIRAKSAKLQKSKKKNVVKQGGRAWCPQCRRAH